MTMNIATQNYKKENQKLITVQMRKEMKKKTMKNLKMEKKILMLNMQMNNKKLACSKCNHHQITNYWPNLNKL